MIHQMFTIFDSKAEVYNKPFYFINETVAIRAAYDLIQAGDSEIAKHPEDFTMFHMGEFDDTSATFNLKEAKTVLCNFQEIAAAVEVDKFRTYPTSEMDDMVNGRPYHEEDQPDQDLPGDDIDADMRIM